MLDGFTLNPGDLDWAPLERLGELTVYDRTEAELVVDRAKDAYIVFVNKTILTAAQLAELPKLKYVGVFATGYNVVDVKAAAKLGIAVTNVPAYSTMSVAQQIFALILAITNRSEHYAQENRKGRWCESPDFAYTDGALIELAGKTFGVVGFGNIGKAATDIARAFGMKLRAFSSKPQSELGDVVKSSLDELFSQSDVVAMCCPLTESNRQMVDARLLSLMRPSAIFINTARGGLVDENALAEALREHRIYAAGLDVLSAEPPTDSNPLLHLDNCYVTPHIAWATLEARRRCLAIAATNLASYLSGTPTNIVS